MPEMPIVLTNLPEDFFKPYLAKVEKVPDFFKIPSNEAEYLNKINNNNQEWSKELLILLNQQTKELMELNDKFLNASSPEEKESVGRIIIKQAKKRAATINKIKETEYRHLLDKEIMGLAGNLMSEKAEASKVSTHALYNNTLIQHDPNSKQLKEELDRLDKEFYSGLTEYKKIQSSASLESLKAMSESLKSIYDQYKGKIAEIGKRRKLLERSDADSLSEARKVIFDAIDKKLRVFDQMEADIKNHAATLKSQDVTLQLAEEIKSIISILKNKDLQLNSAKIDPLITALERRLLYLITDPKDFIEIFGRFKLITPTVSTSPFSSLLKDGWPNPQDESKKDPKVRQNIIKTCYIEANNVAKITDNVTDKLKSSIEDHKKAATIKDARNKIEAELHTFDTSDILSALTKPVAQAQAQPVAQVSAANTPPTHKPNPSSVEKLDFSPLKNKLTNHRQQITALEDLGVNNQTINSRIETIERYIQDLEKLETEISSIKREMDPNKPDKTKLDEIIKMQNNINDIIHSCDQIMTSNSNDIRTLQNTYSQLTTQLIRDLDKKVTRINQDISKVQSLFKSKSLPQLSKPITINTYTVEKLKKELKGQPLYVYEREINNLHDDLIAQKDDIINDICRIAKEQIDDKIKSIEKSTFNLLGDLETIGIPANFKNKISRIEENLNNAIYNYSVSTPNNTSIQSLVAWKKTMEAEFLKIQEIHNELMIVNNTMISLYNNPVHKNSLKLLSDIHGELVTRIKTHNGSEALKEFLKDPNLFFSKPENNKDLKTKALFELYKSVDGVNQILYTRIEGGKKPNRVNTETKMEKEINKAVKEWETDEVDKKGLTAALIEYPKMMDNALTRVLAEQRRNLTTGLTLRTSSTEKRVMRVVDIVQKTCEEALVAQPAPTSRNAPTSNSDSLEEWDLIDEPTEASSSTDDVDDAEEMEIKRPPRPPMT